MNKDTTNDALASVAGKTPPLGEVVRIDEGLIKDHLNKVVVSTVEQTLNALLDAEADRLCGGKRYEHTSERVDTRAGHYERQLHTKAGEVTLKMPKLRSRFEPSREKPVARAAQNEHHSPPMTEIIFEVSEDEADGGYTATALGHAIATQGETMEELREMVREAVHCHFGDGMPGEMPKVIRLHFVRDEVLAV